MARDYSKKNIARPQTNKKGQHPLTLILLSFLIGYLTASLFSFNSLSQWVSKQKMVNFSSSPKEQHKPAAKPQHVELPKPKLEFYTLLTQNKQTVSASKPEPVAHATPPLPEHSKRDKTEKKPANTPTQTTHDNFIIQLASFKTHQEAERLKALLTLKGFDVSIMTVMHQNQSWYRVLTGPYADRVKAERAQNELAKSEHMMGLIYKQG